MKTITQETIVGKVDSISTKGDYIVKFVLKSIREGETAWINVSSNDWQAWSLKAGDEVSLRGQVTSTVWEDPFLNEEVETVEVGRNKICCMMKFAHSDKDSFTSLFFLSNPQNKEKP